MTTSTCTCSVDCSNRYVLTFHLPFFAMNESFISIAHTCINSHTGTHRLSLVSVSWSWHSIILLKLLLNLPESSRKKTPTKCHIKMICHKKNYTCSRIWFCKRCVCVCVYHHRYVAGKWMQRKKPITFIKVLVGHGLPYNMALIKIVKIQHIHIALAIR